MALNRKLLKELQADFAKEAFVPMPGGDPGAGAPMDPAAGGMPPPGGDPAAMGGAPMDPAMGGAPMGGAPMDPAAGGMPPMDPMAGGMPPPAPPAPQQGMISFTPDELLKFITKLFALLTNNKFGAEPKPTDGGPVPDGQAAMNAKLDSLIQFITNAMQGQQV